MAPSAIRKAIGTVKDQTSISLAKVSRNLDPELEVAIVKATSHDDEPTDEKHIRVIFNLTSYSRGYVNACVATVSRRLGKTRNWIVALKALMLVHRLLAQGDPSFKQQLLYAKRSGTRLLNMLYFRDEAHSSSGDHSAFVRAYALYLDQRLESIVHDRNQEEPRRGSPAQYQYSDYEGSSLSSPSERNGGEGRPAKPLGDMKPVKVLDRMQELQQLLDRILSCRPIGLANNSRMVLVALYPIVRESFQLYADICEILAVLLDRFFDMDYADCVKSFEAYAIAAKQIDELAAFYAWCKDTGIARSTEYPEVQQITDKLLETLGEFTRDRTRIPKSPPRREEEAAPALQDEQPAQDMKSIKALHALSDYEEQKPKEEELRLELELKPQPQPQADLIDLRDDAGTADDKGKKLALALFSSAATGVANVTWEAFPSTVGTVEVKVTSAWQTPAAEAGKADWELALVETASNLAKQKAALGGGLHPLLLNGIYDQGAVRQHLSAQASIGRKSSVLLPGIGNTGTQILALPAPNGMVQAIWQDPFAASLSIPPPSYVQIADIDRKQQLVMQEMQMWQQYAMNGMQGQASIGKLNNAYNYPNLAMTHGIPPSPGYYYY